jgi:MATE family multidrug resistance protein
VSAPQQPVALERPTLKGLLTLAWPIVFSRMSQTVIGLSDVLLVADLGSAALAATATGALNAFAVLILPMGIMFMVSSFSAQLFGRGDASGARRFAWYGLLIAGLTQAISLAAVPFIGDALALLPYAPDVRRLMTQYLAIRLLSGGAAIGIEALANAYAGLGRTRPAMVANLAAMVLNVVGNLLLIPPLGVAGAALASTAATWLAFGGFLAYFWRDAPRRDPTQPRPAALARSEFFRLLKFGLPSGLNWFFEFLSFIFFINVVVAGLGTPALAAMNAVFQLNSLAFMPAFGLASAGAILVGQAIGAARKDLVPRTVGLTLGSAVAWQGLVGLVYVAMPALLMQPFAKGVDAAAVAELGVRMLLVSAAWQVFDATATTLAEALRAAGDTLFPMLARLVIAWTVFVPGAWWAVHHWGWTELGTTSWLVAYLALLALTLALRYRSGAWRRVQLLDPLGEVEPRPLTQS